jgi:hypothetical protein
MGNAKRTSLALKTRKLMIYPRLKSFYLSRLRSTNIPKPRIKAAKVAMSI